MTDHSEWISGISALFGAWVFLSAVVFRMAGAQFWNTLVVGGAIAALAGFSASHARKTGSGNRWSSGLAALLGLWTVASPFVYGAVTAAWWSSVVSGSVVAALSGYEAYEAQATTASGVERPSA